MFIRNCLTERKHLTVVAPEDTINTVLQKMDGHLSLPCVDATDRFIGIVSKRTIFEEFTSQAKNDISYEAFLQFPVKDCINTTVTTLTLDNQFEDTLDAIIRNPFVPIVEEGKLIGIVKRGDINQALSIAFATNVNAHRLLLGLADVEGAFQRLFSVTHRLGTNIITVVPFDAGENPLNRRVMLKVAKESNLSVLVDHLERAGFLMIDVVAARAE